MESTGRRALRFTFYTVWAIVMTALTYVLGAAPLRVLRVRFGRLAYWCVGIGVSMVFLGVQNRAMAVAFFSLVLLMGVFDELEEAGFNLMISAFFTVLINTLLGAGVFALWAGHTGVKWSTQLQGALEAMLKPLADFNPHLQISAYDLMLQLPSVIVVLWMGAIYLAILLERQLGASLAETPVGRPDMRAQLAEFRLPDPVVWMFTVALLGAFGGFKIPVVEAVAVNVMNVCVLLFFFQGIAVVAKFFDTIRLSLFWQVLMVGLIVVYLFVVVALLGLMDFWLDFRLRLSKRAEQFNREV